MLPDLNNLFTTVFNKDFSTEDLTIRNNSWLTAGDTVPILENAFYYLNGLIYQLSRKINKYFKSMKKRKLHGSRELGISN